MVGAEGVREERDAHDGADGDGRHQQKPDDLDGPVEALRARVQVPRGQQEHDGISGDDDDGADVGDRAVLPGRHRRRRRHPLKDAGDGERGVVDAVAHGAQDDDAVQGAEHEVHEYEELPQPAEDPVAAEVVDEREQAGVVHGHGQQGEHPDEEEVVWHHGLDLGEPDALDPDARQDLLVRVRVEELAPQDAGLFWPLRCCRVAMASRFLEDEGCADYIFFGQRYRRLGRG